MPLFLHPEVSWVRGPAAGALYDLRNGNVHSVPVSFAPVFDRYIAQGGDLTVAATTLAENTFVQKLEVGGLTVNVDPGFCGEGVDAVLDAEPKLLWLEITGRCNYTCQHCYADSDPQPRQTLPTARWLEIIDEAAAAGFPALQLTGGDPLMHPDVMSLLETAAAHDFDLIELYTNGSMLSERVLDQLERLDISIAMSFYSYDKSVYEKITGSIDTFERATQGIRGALSRAIPLRIGLIEMEENRDHIEETISFLKNLGLAESQIHVDGVRPSGRGSALQPTACGGGGNIVSVDTIQVVPQETPIWREPMAQPTTFRSDRGQVQWNSCWAGEAVIDPDGDIFPCIFSRGTSLGNVATTSLGLVLGGAPVQETWQGTLGTSDDCSDCEFRYACFDCRALTVNVTGNRSAKPPSCIYDPATGTQDWPRWQRQLGDLSAWQARQPQSISAFSVVEENEDSVVLSGEGQDWIAELSYFEAAMLELADGQRTIQDIVTTSKKQGGDLQTIVMTYWNLESRGLVTSIR